MMAVGEVQDSRLVGKFEITEQNSPSVKNKTLNELIRLSELKRSEERNILVQRDSQNKENFNVINTSQNLASQCLENKIVDKNSSVLSNKM
jgi:hypothetical protein